MNGRRRVAAVILAAATLGASSACGAGGTSAGDPGATSAERPTYQRAPAAEGLLVGTLAGTAVCVWIEAAERRVALVLVDGLSVGASDGEVALVAPDGTVVARTGDLLKVGGGFDPAVVPCADADATSAGGWVVGRIEHTSQSYVP